MAIQVSLAPPIYRLVEIGIQQEYMSLCMGHEINDPVGGALLLEELFMIFIDGDMGLCKLVWLGLQGDRLNNLDQLSRWSAVHAYIWALHF